MIKKQRGGLSLYIESEDIDPLPEFQVSGIAGGSII